MKFSANVDFTEFIESVKRLQRAAQIARGAFIRLQRWPLIYTLNDLEAATRAVGIEPHFHRDPEQDLWAQIDKMRLRLESTS